MKALLVLALVAAAVAKNLWADPASHTTRLAIIEEVNSQDSIWRAGVNPRFDGTSYNYLKSLLGSFEDREANHAHLPTAEIEVGAIPDSFDWRTQSIASTCKSVSEVRDQSNCGSCWAFGAAEAATDRICIQTNGSTNFHISAQDINSCCSTCGSGCGGGYPSSAWSWLVHTGSVSGGNYHDYAWCYSYSMQNCDHHTTGQYTPCTSLPSYPTPKCTNACDPQETGSYTYGTDKHKFKKSYSIPNNVAQLQTELMTNGPFEVSFSVYADFESYTGGVYVHKTGAYMGGHAVKFIGWGVDNGTPYWSVANSWNEDWGEKGFFRIVRGVNECGIEASGCGGMFV